MNKPVTIIKEEFLAQLTDLINNSGLAPIILESIFKDIYGDMKILYRNQLEADKQRYYSSLQEVVENEVHDETGVRETDGENQNSK